MFWWASPVFDLPCFPGLVGGSVPVHDELVLSLLRMNHIEALEPRRSQISWGIMGKNKKSGILGYSSHRIWDKIWDITWDMTDSIIQLKAPISYKNPQKHSEQLDILEPLGENIIELLGPS